MNLMKTSPKLKFFIGKLPHWSRRLQDDSLANFSFLDGTDVESGASVKEKVELEIVVHFDPIRASSATVADPDQAFGGSVKQGRAKTSSFVKYPWFFVTIGWYHINLFIVG